MVAQGEIWLMETPNAKRRPVLVVSRDQSIPVLRDIVVAPITATIRPIPTNVAVGPEEGVEHDSVASFDLLSAVPKSVLTVRLGELPSTRRHELCDALSALADC